MNCNICGSILNYMGGDCYACPEHGWDWMMSAKGYLRQEYDLDEEDALSAIESSHHQMFNRGDNGN